MTRSTIPWLRGRLQTHSLDALQQGVEFHIGRPNTFNNFDEYEWILRQCTELEYWHGRSTGVLIMQAACSVFM
jgi:hypothetical protein